ncbi:hypothetical protein ACXX82_17605 [Glaciimonas sp. GNP009]
MSTASAGILSFKVPNQDSLVTRDKAIDSIKAIIPPIQGPCGFNLPEANSSLTATVGFEKPFLVQIQNNSHFYQESGTWIALAALAVSVTTFLLNQQKDSRARKQSIQDDFWLRKVAFPGAMDPTLEFFSWLIAELPNESNKLSTNNEQIESFREKFQEQHRLIARKLILMGSYSLPLYQKLNEIFQDLEDCIVTYCHANSEGYQGKIGSTSSRSATEIEITNFLNDMILAIRNSQEDL